jgi:hypothetical protein
MNIDEFLDMLNKDTAGHNALTCSCKLCMTLNAVELYYWEIKETSLLEVMSQLVANTLEHNFDTCDCNLCLAIKVIDEYLGKVKNATI